MSQHLHRLSPAIVLSDNDFKTLLNYFDRSWSGYRRVRKGVIKRVRQHMAAFDCKAVNMYIERLEKEPELRAACESLFNVTISRFFRDRQLWRFLQESCLPQLAQQFPSPIKIWSAGCACGEEPYSLAILWSTLSLQTELDILATDAQQICLDRAQIGHFKKSSLKEVPKDLLASCFKTLPKTNEYAILPHLKKSIRWQRADLLESIPMERFQLILLRNNVLTYFQGEKREKTFLKIFQQLTPGGHLAIGAHEQLPIQSLPLVPSGQCPLVFHRTVQKPKNRGQTTFYLAI
jgi:chemotaxis methyl-accepting protein methylase